MTKHALVVEFAENTKLTEISVLSVSSVAKKFFVSEPVSPTCLGVVFNEAGCPLVS